MCGVKLADVSIKDKISQMDKNYLDKVVDQLVRETRLDDEGDRIYGYSMDLS